ncbi:MAG: cell division protein FtsZ [Fibrobacter sp.]|mgnify:CR=1 FL=1|nr:cell division protein FtsZ [Fibrobacter sp.]
MSEFTNINFDAKSRVVGEEQPSKNAKVKVFGVGGAGGNTVNRMKKMKIEGGVEYYAINTDLMALDLSLADHKIAIGEKTTKGLGAGMDPEKARKAVEENLEDIKEAMKGADLVFITAGMGGGTGTGAAPIVAHIARELGILTVGVVTKPFRWEGNARSKIAQEGIRNLRAEVDTIIVVENRKLLLLIQNSANQKATVEESYRMADEILGNAVQSICGIMFHHGTVHVDFADIRKVMLQGGTALMGTGFAQGEDRGVLAADMALASPLLEDVDIKGASGVLINVAHGENYSLLEHDKAMEHIYEKVGEENEPNIIIGDITIPELGDKVSITIIATGCGGTSGPIPCDRGNVSESATSASTISASTFIPPSLVPSPLAGVAFSQQQTVQTPAVQQATPRPTSINLFDMAKPSMPQSAPQQVIQPAAQPSTPAVEKPIQTSSMPSLTDSQIMRAVGSTFSDSDFNAIAPAEETTLATPVYAGHDTAEFSATADEDRLNGGRGGYETPAIMRRPTEPAYPNAGRRNAVEDDMKDGGIDYNVPSFLRNSSTDLF